MSAQVYDLKGKQEPVQTGQTVGLTQLLHQYSKPGPRYTSYPTIDQCSESVDQAAYVQALEGRKLGGLQRPMSLYVHIPFCASVCYYCACNKVVTKKRDRVQEYLDMVLKEAEWVVNQSKSLTPVFQFHLGGGTPTFLNDLELAQLVRSLEALFVFDPHAERSIEVDPRTVNQKRLKRLYELGFNRLSFGVQDFDGYVQEAVHRVQTFESISNLMKSAREIGFKSINVDLIYGLPLQTRKSFETTLQQLIKLDPDRVALYSYAHLPERFKPQRRIDAELLPQPAMKVEILEMAIQMMREAGYEYIGMDHFAKPTDSLAVARRKGMLHRNFQGYTTMPDAD
ncbi:MAG: oxygen-independent coproporphyrinogen III oxidase, partial [Limnobacter sp.]|nr:oxygen-independent coproporphyrinogen III oxidase [Limnobacter sp.]